MGIKKKIILAFSLCLFLLSLSSCALIGNAIDIIDMIFNEEPNIEDPLKSGIDGADVFYLNPYILHME